MKKIIVLGSTGSIGRQTLEVVRAYPKDFKVVGLACARNWQLLLKQIKEFKPLAAAVYDKKAYLKLKQKLGRIKVRVFTGENGLDQLASFKEGQLVVVAVLGAIGIRPTLAAIAAKKTIALATKEVLVAAGDLVKKEAKKNQVAIIPVDSEHSAIFQCLAAGKKTEVKRIYLTCSGGPFFGKTLNELQLIKVSQALKHPKWKMGAKITIDSATLMNKGLEVIEAMELFDLRLSQVKVVVHPQSIIHSMVEYQDGNIIAQLGPHDMRLAIRHALSFPKRLANKFFGLNLLVESQLTFAKPDTKTFRCLALAFKAAKIAGTMPVVLNAANEVAVEAFLEEKISFLKIPKIIKKVMMNHKVISKPSLDQILKADLWARGQVLKELKNG